jgi:UTP--glucose-1-phosphate uridylyltransferase
VEERRQIDERFAPFARKMGEGGLDPIVVETFRHYYDLLVSGETGKIPGSRIDPVAESDIADLQDLHGLEAIGREAAQRTAVIKLNGGLGTSMGLAKAKSLLKVKEGLTFLDVTVRQALTYREKTGATLPLAFMNSFATHADTMEALKAYPDLQAKDIPLCFLQHKFPKVLREDLSPASWPQDRELEWNPPGHGDIYTSLVSSGMLSRLVEHGVAYAFVSNVDNLGAIIDNGILGYFAHNDFPFMMEAADRTESDTKGGHLARKKDGGLVLREIAQCPEEELDEFQDIRLFKYFNTNSIWINLEALKKLLDNHDNVIPLPMIRNPKTLDPRDESSPPVYQLETAMGSAIALFDRATAVRVPRSRFLPVKKSQDLLGIWSDAYLLSPDYQMVRNPAGDTGPPKLSLDDRYFKKIDQLQARFPYGAPSLVGCASLRVEGDVRFGRDIDITGDVVVKNESDSPMTIPDGSQLTTTAQTT